MLVALSFGGVVGFFAGYLLGEHRSPPQDFAQRLLQPSRQAFGTTSCKRVEVDQLLARCAKTP
jgi:hypothetical protein